jgi:hypothetical protein
MSSDEEEPGRAVSYSARLSSSGAEGRRSSFGAKLADDISKEGGELDIALGMSMPSDIPTFRPFKVCKNAVDGELFIAAQENPDVIAKHVALSEALTVAIKEMLKTDMSEACKKYYRMSEEEVVRYTKEYVNPDDLARIQGKENGERNGQAHIVMNYVLHTMLHDVRHLADTPINLALETLMPMQDAIFQGEKELVKDKTLNVFKKKIEDAIKGSSKAKAKNMLSHSQVHFRETLEQLKQLFKSYLALDEQYTRAVTSHTSILAELEGATLKDHELDAKVAEASRVSTRSSELKKIKDHKMSQIFLLLEKRYPDIAGSAQNALSQKQKSIAMHSLKLDADIINGKPDHTKSTKFIADLLQICQAWLPLFWALIPALMEIQQHDDKVTPIKALLFEEMKDDRIYGRDLGTIVETQASQLWLVVARGSVESMPALSMGTAEASLFSEIKTGGNGEDVRKSNVQHKNIISLALYIKHYHEKNLLSDRRKNEAILNVAWAEFADGPILKACERLLVHWQAAMRLGSEVKWHAFMQKAIVALNDRCNGEMQSFLTQEYLLNEKLKSQYADNCLPLWNKFLSDVSNIARNLSSDSPKKYASADVEASKSSLNAFAGTIKPVQPKTSGSSIQDGPASDWVCNAQGCNGKISQMVKDMIQSSRNKQGNSSTSCPISLLCESHHNSHTAGNDVTLKNGKIKDRTPHQRKNAKSNAVTTEGDSAENKQSGDDAAKKPGKNRKANQKRKERMKKAMALLKEQEKSEPGEDIPPAAASAASSNKPKKGFDPSSLSGGDLSKAIQFAAGLHMTSNAEAADSPADSPQEEQKEVPIVSTSHGNVVKRLMGILSDSNADPAQAVVSSNHKSNAVHSRSLAGNISSGVYIPK